MRAAASSALWFLATAAVLLGAGPAQAQGADPDQPPGAEELSLEELLDLPISVASRLSRSTRESPGVVTRFGREELAASGARDLLELLERVPGFWPALDVQGVVDVGFRGIWAHEGKVQLLIDGVPLNEPLYDTLQLGNRYALDQLESVEIVRGPGSVVYGGNAELAVISLRTRSSSGPPMLAASATLDGTRHGPSREVITASASGGIGAVRGLSAGISATLGHGQRSDGTYADFQGKTFPMQGRSALAPLFVDAWVNFRALRLRFIEDDLRMQTQDGYGDVLPGPNDQTFRATHLDALLDLALTPWARLQPHVSYSRVTPWNVANRADLSTARDSLYYDKTAQRLVTGLSLDVEATDTLRFILGGEARFDRARLNALDAVGTGSQLLFQGQPTIDNQNVAGYGELSWSLPIGTLSGGLRVERHSLFGGSITPRLGFVKRLGPLHFKLLAASAFRAPALENLRTTRVEPERAWNFEAEVGAQVGETVFVSANVFDARVHKPIVYDVIDGQGSYQNASGRLGSRGAELVARTTGSLGQAELSYSFYAATHSDEVMLYQARDRSALLLALPAHKVSAFAGLRVGPFVTITPSLVVISERAAMLGAPGGGQVAGTLPAVALANLSATLHDLVAPGLALRAGVYNLFDAAAPTAQAYDGGHAPLPQPGREFDVKLSYEHTF